MTVIQFALAINGIDAAIKSRTRVEREDLTSAACDMSDARAEDVDMLRTMTLDQVWDLAETFRLESQ